MSKTNASVREDVASGVVRTAINHRVAHALDQEEHRLAELIASAALLSVIAQSLPRAWLSTTGKVRYIIQPPTKAYIQIGSGTN